MTSKTSSTEPVTIFDWSGLNEPPKPGSRRARRLAEQARKRATSAGQKGSAVSRSADTAEIPAVAQAHAGSQAGALIGRPQVTVAGGEPFAETMNHTLVTRRVKNSPKPEPRRFSKSSHLAGAASVVALATGASVGLLFVPTNPAPAQLAVAAANSDAAEPTIDTAASEIAFAVTVDGGTQKITANPESTYAAAFAEAGIEIGARDEVSVSLADTVTTAPVTIVRVTTATVTEEHTTDFDTERVEDPNLPEGEEKVETEGVPGRGTRSYQVTYRDGEESGRVILVETEANQPVTEVIRVGTKPAAAQVVAEDGTDRAPVAPPPVAAPVPAGSARQIAQGMLSSYGWGMDQWSCLDALWERESNWNHTAANPSSGAYGIPQALPGSKMASAGADWRTNPATQIAWGLGYIQGRYGSPCGAWGHSQARGWY